MVYPQQPLEIKGCDEYETYFEDNTIYLRPKWYPYPEVEPPQGRYLVAYDFGELETDDDLWVQTQDYNSELGWNCMPVLAKAIKFWMHLPTKKKGKKWKRLNYKWATSSNT